jgi:hypothetical protein
MVRMYGCCVATQNGSQVASRVGRRIFGFLSYKKGGSSHGRLSTFPSTSGASRHDVRTQTSKRGPAATTRRRRRWRRVNGPARCWRRDDNDARRPVPAAGRRPARFGCIAAARERVRTSFLPGMRACKKPDGTGVDAPRPCLAVGCRYDADGRIYGERLDRESVPRPAEAGSTAHAVPGPGVHTVPSSPSDLRRRHGVRQCLHVLCSVLPAKE